MEQGPPQKLFHGAARGSRDLPRRSDISEPALIVARVAADGDVTRLDALAAYTISASTQPTYSSIESQSISRYQQTADVKRWPISPP
jgi:hypothetical protein